eukprot:7146636-Pyramimonas_sp.AAC.1
MPQRGSSKPVASTWPTAPNCIGAVPEPRIGRPRDTGLRVLLHAVLVNPTPHHRAVIPDLLARAIEDLPDGERRLPEDGRPLEPIRDIVMDCQLVLRDQVAPFMKNLCKAAPRMVIARPPLRLKSRSEQAVFRRASLRAIV